QQHRDDPFVQGPQQAAGANGAVTPPGPAGRIMTEPMTDATFEELLGADPLSQDPAFLAAARATPARQAAWESACAFERRLRASLAAVQAPATLLPRLLEAVGVEPLAPT